jgi:lipoprotein signal peptidase
MIWNSLCLAGGGMQIGVFFLSVETLIILDQTANEIVVARFAGSYLLNPKIGKPVPLAILWLGELLLLSLLFGVGPLAQNAWAAVALGAALGAAASNLIDRACRGGVVDFIDLKIWPVFNIADAAIVIGAGAGTVALLGGS